MVHAVAGIYKHWQKTQLFIIQVLYHFNNRQNTFWMLMLLRNGKLHPVVYIRNFFSVTDTFIHPIVNYFPELRQQIISIRRIGTAHECRNRLAQCRVPLHDQTAVQIPFNIT